MDLHDGARYAEYDLAYYHSAYAAERLQEPFERIENTMR
jgi:hypothetical protein